MSKRKYAVFSTLASCAVMLCVCAVGGAEYFTIRKPAGTNSSPVRVIATNETVELVHLRFEDFDEYIAFEESGWLYDYSEWNLPQIGKPILTGPSSVSLKGNNQYPSFATFKITKNSPETSLTTPSTAVVIPEDANGPVQIILESSTDLVTWTAASPGTYGASTTKRFFRVRAVKQ